MRPLVVIVDIPDTLGLPGIPDLASEWASPLHADDLTVFAATELHDPEGLAEMRNAAPLTKGFRYEGSLAA